MSNGLGLVVRGSQVKVCRRGSGRVVSSLHEKSDRHGVGAGDGHELRKRALSGFPAGDGCPEVHFGREPVGVDVETDLVDQRPVAGRQRSLLIAVGWHPTEGEARRGPHHSIAVVGDLSGAQLHRPCRGSPWIVDVDIEVDPGGAADSLESEEGVALGGYEGGELRVSAPPRRQLHLSDLRPVGRLEFEAVSGCVDEGGHPRDHAPTLPSERRGRILLSWRMTKCWPVTSETYCETTLV